MHDLSRRVVLTGMAASAALPAIGRFAHAQEATKALYEAARKDGQVSWYVSSMTAESAKAVGDRFSELYPGVRVDVVRTTAEVAFQRVAQELKASAVQADVLTTADVGQFVTLRKQGELLQYTPESTKTMIDNAAVRNIDPEGHYHVTTSYLMGIAVNSAKVPASDMPKRWADFMDPKWKGQLSISHPGFSGIAGVWGVQMQKWFGPEIFAKIEKNSPLVSRSNIDAATAISTGERLIGTAADHIVLGLAKKGTQVQFIAPEEGAILETGITGALKRTKRENATKLFLEFLHSADMSRIMVKDFQASLHPDVPPAPGIRPLNEVSFVVPTPDEIASGLPGTVTLFRQVFGI